MDPMSLELVRTLVATAIVLTAGAIGLLALPWTDDDLRASRAAFAALPGAVVALVRAALARHHRSRTTPPPAAPAEPWESATAAPVAMRM